MRLICMPWVIYTTTSPIKRITLTRLNSRLQHTLVAIEIRETRIYTQTHTAQLTVSHITHINRIHLPKTATHERMRIRLLKNHWIHTQTTQKIRLHTTRYAHQPKSAHIHRSISMNRTYQCNTEVLTSQNGWTFRRSDHPKPWVNFHSRDNRRQNNYTYRPQNHSQNTHLNRFDLNNYRREPSSTLIHAQSPKTHLLALLHGRPHQPRLYHRPLKAPPHNSPKNNQNIIIDKNKIQSIIGDISADESILTNQHKSTNAVEFKPDNPQNETHTIPNATNGDNTAHSATNIIQNNDITVDYIRSPQLPSPKLTSSVATQTHIYQHSVETQTDTEIGLAPTARNYTF